jgi:hypothetical protein
MKNLADIRIYGDGDSGVWVGPKTATFPTFPALPGASDPMKEVGWISEDGAPVSKDQDNTAHNAWQGGKIVRRRFTSTEDTFQFTALEENAIVMGLWEPGATVTTTSGVTRLKPAVGVPSDERKWMIRFIDGGIEKRYEVIRGEVMERGELPHKNDEMTAYQFTVVMYEYEIVTNNPALAVAGS